MIYKKIFLSVGLVFGFIMAAGAGDFNALYRTGLRKLQAGDYAGALTAFKAAFGHTELSGEEVRVLTAIADVYARQKQYREAENWLRRVLDLPDLKRDDKVKTYLRLIDYAIFLGHYEDALGDADTALNRLADKADKAVFLRQRARIFELKQDYPKAVQALQECIKKCEPGSAAWQEAEQHFITVLFKQKRYEQILTHLAGLKLNEQEAVSWRIICYYAGQCASRQGNYQLAATWFERMPDKGPAWLIYSKNSQLGDCWRKLGQYEKAYKCFEIIYRNTELHNYYRASGLWMMAELGYLQGKYRDARRLCEELKNFPGASENQKKRAAELLSLLKKRNAAR
ncbi:MAG: tetratricopeptide repeat protein [Victivallaceae bacterium]|nr:tetratricopeptide repeat protein [Victivallaceae bacterium]